MSSSPNPLQRYFRQPKIYISLPSKGTFYPPGTLQGDHSNMPVLSMTGMDEILFKTPDALFNGDSTVKVIESCCPYVKNAEVVPSIDVDTILVAIRISTYGEILSIEHTCKNCGHENDYDINLNTVLDYFNTQQFDGNIQIKDLEITLRPLTYKEITEFNIENFKLQKMLFQINRSTTDDDDARVRELQTELYQKIAEVQSSLFVRSIENVRIGNEVVTDFELIAEWLQNSEKEFFQEIKKRLEKNKEQWAMPKQNVKCGNCETEDDIEISLDPSNFFGRG